VRRVLILAGVAALALSAVAAAPASAHDDRDNRYRDSYRGYGYSRRDADHERHHRRLEREHDRAHRRGFDSRRDHERWHRRAGEHHDGDHHRIYDRHAPNRKRYYGDGRDYRWDGRYPRGSRR
jgi:hypothetical protein